MCWVGEGRGGEDWITGLRLLFFPFLSFSSVSPSPLENFEIICVSWVFPHSNFQLNGTSV